MARLRVPPEPDPRASGDGSAGGNWYAVGVTAALPDASPLETPPFAGAPAARRALHPACPHCGYDLSGIAGSWKQLCPLRGRCSECGGWFWWSDLLGAAARSQVRLFDSAPRAGVYELGGTLFLAMLNPRRFWRLAAEGEGAVRWRRLLVAALAAPWAGAMVTVEVLLPIALAGAAFSLFYLGDHDWFYESFEHVAWLPGDWRDGELRSFVSPWSLFPALVFGGAAVAALTFSTTLWRAGVSRATGTRIWVWSLVWSPLALAVWGIGGVLAEAAFDSYIELTYPADELAAAVEFLIDRTRGPGVMMVSTALVFVWWREALVGLGARRPQVLAAMVTGLAFVIAASSAVFVAAARLAW